MEPIRTVEGLRQAYPELSGEIAKIAVEPEKTARVSAETRLTEATAETTRLKESVATLTKERDDEKAKAAKLAGELDEVRARESVAAKKATVTRLIEASKLKEHIGTALVSDTFRTTLEAAKDEDAMKALIADREAIAEGRTVEGHGTPSGIEKPKSETQARSEAFATSSYWGKGGKKAAPSAAA